MTSLTTQQIDKVTKAHTTAELAKDVDATMATVGPHPHWEYHPVELALVDREAVRAVYQIFNATIWPFLSMTTRSCIYGDNCVWYEQAIRFSLEGYPEGREVDSHVSCLVVIDDEYVVGERVYYGGPLATIVDRIFDESFRALPGVVDLSVRS